MIHVEYDEINDKAKIQIEGNLGLIYAELGLVVLKIAENEDLEMTTDDVIEQIKDAIEYNIRKTKNKKKLLFDKSFIEKIKEGKKIFTVRNKPIPLGIYSIDAGLKIEIIGCEKVEAYFHKYIGENSISFNRIGDLQRQGKSINTKFGFDKHSEMVDFYKGYLKNQTAYLMHFRVVS
jgi:hypothetical protein